MKNIIKLDPLLITTKKELIVTEPKIIRVNEFTEESAKIFSQEMNDAHNTGQNIIPIVIDSYGGYVDSLLSMVSDIEHSDLTVATVCVGKAMSCGSVLLSCGADGFRFADSLSRIMIHEIGAGHFGKNEDLKASAKETDRLQKLVFSMMAKNCGHSNDYFIELMHSKKNADWYLTPKEAKKHNLINEIRVPKLVTEVNVAMHLT
jgi:ATP-dependent Clp protease protease subunit